MGRTYRSAQEEIKFNLMQITEPKQIKNHNEESQRN